MSLSNFLKKYVVHFHDYYLRGVEYQAFRTAMYIFWTIFEFGLSAMRWVRITDAPEYAYDRLKVKIDIAMTGVTVHRVNREGGYVIRFDKESNSISLSVFNDGVEVVHDPVTIGYDGYYNLFDDSYMNAFSVEEALDTPCFWIYAKNKTLPSASMSSSCFVQKSDDILNFLAQRAKMRNRVRYDDEGFEAFRTRLIVGVGRNETQPALIKELQDKLRYTPTVETKIDEGSGFFIVGLSHVDYSGFTSGSLGGQLQERFRGCHVRDDSSVEWKAFITLHDSDDDEGLDEILERTLPAPTMPVLRISK